MIRTLIIITILLVSFSCKTKRNSDKLSTEVKTPQKIDIVADTALWDSLKNLTALSFLDKVRKNKTTNKELNFLTIEDDATPKAWLKKEDIDTLISLIKSNERCVCIVDPLSSYLPTNDYAELGGYAMILLNFYKNKGEIRFPLYTCPKKNEEEADKLLKWRATQKH